MKEDDGGAENGDGEGVAESVEEAEAHAFAPGALDAGDVGDGGEVVVVEAVAQAEESTGEKSEFERGRHCCSLGYREQSCVGEVEWPLTVWRSWDGFAEGDGGGSGSEA